MPTLSLIPIIIFGLIYLRFNHVARFKIHLQSPQQYIFNILAKGFIFFMLSFWVMCFFSLGLINSLDWLVWSLAVYKFLSGYNSLDINFIEQSLHLMTLGALISFLSAYLKNKLLAMAVSKRLNPYSKEAKEKEKIYSLYKAFKQDLIKTTLVDAVLYEKIVLIDMSNDKIYISKVYDISQPDENYHSNTYDIIPIKSGFRDDRKEIVITTDYGNEFKFKNTIKGENIIAVKEYDDETFKFFLKKKETPKFEDIGV